MTVKWVCITICMLFIGLMHSDYQKARVEIEKIRHSDCTKTNGLERGGMSNG